MAYSHAETILAAWGRKEFWQGIETGEDDPAAEAEPEVPAQPELLTASAEAR